GKTILLIIIFLLQAEDGIRDRNVTGVQTCALPILSQMKCKGEDYMEEYEIIKLRGVVDASKEHNELFITEFVRQKDGFILENSYDLIELLERADGKKTTITIKIEGDN